MKDYWMLRLSKEHRPRQLLVVYVEQQGVEILRAHRQLRTWQVDSAEHLDIPEGESVYEYLQRLNLRSGDTRSTTLLLFLPLTFYTFHREHYPSGLRDHLQEALNFDWQENVFLEHERMMCFPGPALSLNHNLSVPIFTLQRDLFDRFYQILGAAAFRNFRVIPTALAYKAFVARSPAQSDPSELEIFGRLVDPSHIELHRFYNGQFLDSVLLGNNQHNRLVFLEQLRSIDDGPDVQIPPVHILCTSHETLRTDGLQPFFSDELHFEIKPLEGLLVSHWMEYLFQQDLIQTFDERLLLKPWQIPRIAWPILVVIGLYLVFALSMVHTHRQLQEASRRLKKEIAQLELQWKPIEQLQTRIAKFQEDQKTLSEFNREGYPLLEILSLLSQVTPEDTWLNYFSIRKGQVILRGDSKSAIKYLPELSKIEGFSDVRFASPVTRSPNSEDERFNVQLQVDNEKLRKTLSAMDFGKGEESLDPSSLDQPPTVAPIIENKPESAAPTDQMEEEDEADEEDDEDMDSEPETAQ